MKEIITLDGTPLLYPNGGVGRVTKTLLDTMSSLDSEYEFRLYARQKSGDSLKDLERKEQCTHLRWPQFTEPLIKGLSLIERLTGADLVHATDHYLPVGKAEKSIVTVHDLIFLVEPETRWKQHDYLAKVVPDYLRKCKHIITCSEYSKQDMIKHLNIAEEKISVILWGIDKTVFKPAENREKLLKEIQEEFSFDKPYFLSVACSVGRKNTPMLLECYQELLKENPEHELIIVWNPPDEIREKYKNEKRIHFTGRVSDQKLVELYQGANVLIYPSSYEGFGLPVLEAMSTDTAVITSSATSIPEVGGDSVIYIDHKDKASLLEAMRSIDRDEATIERLIVEGRERAKLFSWERCARETLEVYKSCLETL